MKNSKITLLFVFSIVFFSYGLKGVESSKVKLLTPAGQKLIDKEREDYPDFDKQKAVDAAVKRYPLLEIGTEISVTYTRNEAKGKFYGIEGRFARIGSSKVPLMDLSDDMLSKLSKEKNSELRAQYVSSEKSLYYMDRKNHLAKIADEIYSKYPRLEKSQLESFFCDIDDKKKRDSYVLEFMSIFEKDLPLKISISDEKKKTLEKFLARHSELLFENGKVLDRKKLEAALKAAEEKEKKRLAMIEGKIVFPKSATPVFEPDGGTINLDGTVEITCSTPETVIHYTLDGKTPDMDSPVYTEPLPLKTLPMVKAIAIHPEFNDSDIAQNAEFAPPHGLYRSYYSFLDFTGPTFNQIDPTIDFTWKALEKPHEDKESGKHIPWLMNSALWTGQIKPEHSEEYTLYLTADDAARLWLNGKLVLSSWKEQAITEVKRTLKLKGGQNYHIKIAFVELYNGADLKLEWSSPSTPRQVVPSSALLPTGKYTDIVKKWNAAEDKTELTNPGAYKGQYYLTLKAIDPERTKMIYSKKIADGDARSDYADEYDLRRNKNINKKEPKDKDKKKNKKDSIKL